jgi:hypothetical protein
VRGGGTETQVDGHGMVAGARAAGVIRNALLEEIFIFKY